MAVVAVLHPGAMGASVAAALAVGHHVLWCSDGRSVDTAQRAADLEAVGSLHDLCARSDVIVSVCPPDAAVAVAHQVNVEGFSGTYVDANAVSPATASSVRAALPDATVVDGGIIGPPAWTAGTTRLYLAGEGADAVAELFEGSPLAAIDLTARRGDPERSAAHYGAASALKMAYAAWTKGSSALLLTVAAFAEQAGVAAALRDEWDVSQPGTVTRAERTAGGVGPKAWRFVGEMNEIAAAFDAAGVTPAFHEGAADSYQRLAGFKGTNSPNLDEIIAALLRR